MNEAANPVYFDLLTVTRPQDQALVSQENHYYPLGLPLSGVAVSTVPAEKISKQQFNGGSELQDELLGAEGGVYSTFYRTYDPATGRFTGVDPLSDAFTDLSPYRFGNNDPVNFNDPSGALSQPIFMYGALMNPRGVSGEREWAGTDLDSFTYQQGGAGITYGGNEVMQINGVTGYYTVFSTSTTSNQIGSIYGNNTIGAISLTANFNLIPTHVTDEKGFFGKGLDFIKQQYSGVTDLLTTAEKTLFFNKGRNLDRLAYNLTKSKSMINPLTGAILKTGQLNGFIRSSSKFLSRAGIKLGPLGTVLSVSKIIFDISNNTYDASTAVDALTLVFGVVFISNPVVVTGLAVYGLADYTFDISGKIDANFGRNSATFQTLTK